MVKKILTKIPEKFHVKKSSSVELQTLSLYLQLIEAFPRGVLVRRCSENMQQN